MRLAWSDEESAEVAMTVEVVGCCGCFGQWWCSRQKGRGAYMLLGLRQSAVKASASCTAVKTSSSLRVMEA
jgi:hypothetical protein